MLEIIQVIGFFGFIFYLILTLLVADAARARRRSSFNWFVISLVFTPPVALVWVLILEKGAEPRSHEKKCPYCKEIVKKEASKCNHCGSIIKKPTTDSAKTEQVKNEG